MKEIKLPEIALVLLVGPSSAGKSTFARQHFLPTEVISSDHCRALVSDDENNLDVTTDAFDVLNYLAAKRLKRGKLTVVDALNLRQDDRAKLVRLAKDNYALTVAIVLQTPIRQLFDRHALRTDRNFGRGVIEKQFDAYKQSLRSIEREGFTYVYYVDPGEEIGIVRQPLWNNRKYEKGGFDIIGDIHGCFDELTELLAKLGYGLQRDEAGHFRVQSPPNRRAIFLGDLTDRGPQSAEVLRLVMDMTATGQAFCISGNHDEKLLKYLMGKNVNPNHGFESTMRQLATTSSEFRNEVKRFLNGLIAHYVLDDGKLVVAHGGLPEAMHGRASGAVRAFCLYGETTGEIDEFGLPVRYEWAKDYRGKAMVVYGHTPVPQAEWLNNTINVDTGCVFGGQLSALRYPEREVVSVPSRAVYCEPIRPLGVPAESALSAQQEYDDLLDMSLLNGKYLVETGFGSKVIVREENAAAALEVMSRFALHPKWLIYLPPTMSPPETSRLPQYLEHPQEVFDYYRKNGVDRVICEEKHMGSRAMAIVCQHERVAVERFGLSHPAPGVIYTRTGRRFFNDAVTETQFLRMLHQALTDAGFWEKFNTDWVCLDGELMPWSAKARELIIHQYAAVGASGRAGLKEVIAALEKAAARGLAVEGLLSQYQERETSLQKYVQSYRHYCRETQGIEGLVFAPFHLLATEGQTYFDQTHPWHLEQIGQFCAHNTHHLMVTNHRLVDLYDEESVQQAISWWTDLTAAGGEGMVVKPLAFVPRSDGKLIQPAMKCRGSEYLRIIYGPEYDQPANLRSLKERNVKAKRNLAIQEFTLGLASLDRFVKREPLRSIHECVFGVLALESEAVDPRL
jgi:polynucleotide kinase-phosphatase